MAKILYTAFPVNNDKSNENLAEVVSKWIARSPHRNIKLKELEGIENDGFQMTKGPVTIYSIKHKENKSSLYGIRLIEKSDAIHTTDIVGDNSDVRFIVSLTHNYEAEKLGTSCKSMTMPNVMREIVKTLGGGFDGRALLTRAEPYVLHEESLESIAEIIRNETENKLPIIYVSKSNTGDMLINNPANLADYFAGVAHVLIEPSVDFSFKLGARTDGKNTYGGAVGIHWPNGMKRFMLTKPTAQSVERALYNEIRSNSINILVPETLEFNGIRSIQNIKRLDDLKKQYSHNQIQLKERQTDLEEKVKLLDSERKNVKDKEANIQSLQKIIEEKDNLIKEKDKIVEEKDMYINDISAVADDERKTSEEKIKVLNEQNTNLTYTNMSLSNKKQPEAGNILRAPQGIRPIYEGEIEDITRDALNHYLARGVDSKSRRADILKSTLDLNPQSEGGKDLREKVRNLCKTYHKVNDSFIKDLESLGFKVDYSSKQLRVSVRGHDSREISISLTPSAQNAGDNICSDIIKYLL